ncbi:ISAs1 family transposase [Moorena sp. SIO3H5]|uniref:ISAs1 family transposase n=1 Tax=Moorena sp. SIO3H5 TaxID=2607834 RepID=UPI0013BE1FAE|nr:ISAs1 family transposase [Moorena sp. SIO3H5]NEO71789.1 ISAs1 family transposase [Moorena sp. SIO3H5]
MPWLRLKTLIRVESVRQFKKGKQHQLETETRYYVASFIESAESFAQGLRGYWGVENKVHYVRDVTMKQDASRKRKHQLPQIFAVARNFALNIYRSNGFSIQYGSSTAILPIWTLTHKERIFRMK